MELGIGEGDGGGVVTIVWLKINKNNGYLEHLNRTGPDSKRTQIL